MKTEYKLCLNCANGFLAPLREIKRGNGKFCSKSCALAKGRNSRVKKFVIVECSWCGTMNEVKPSRLKNSKKDLHFCDIKCKGMAQRIGGLEKAQLPHYSKVKTEYRDTAFKLFKNECNNCGYKKEIGVLVVHHKDRNRKNNEAKNLEILCPNCHAEEHYRNRDGIFSKMGSGTA